MLKSTNIYKAQRPTKAYLNHRENQRERILEVAESLFTRGGIQSNPFQRSMTDEKEKF
jgi:hypothetical protein